MAQAEQQEGQTEHEPTKGDGTADRLQQVAVIFRVLADRHGEIRFIRLDVEAIVAGLGDLHGAIAGTDVAAHVVRRRGRERAE